MIKVIALMMPVVLVSNGVAQNIEEPKVVNFHTLPKRFVSDERKMWTSPFRSSSYDSKAFYKYVIPFVIISGVLIATDRKIRDELPNSNDQAVWSGRVSQMGTWYSLGGFSAMTYLTGRFSRNSHLRETGMLALEALGHTQVAVFAIKQVTNRERPLDFDRRYGFWEGGNSFPSGHAAGAFAVAAVFAREYHDYPAVPIAAYSIAGLISASRIGARRHWASDIFVGGSMGFLIGRFTYRRNHDPKLPGSKVMRAERLVPKFGFARQGPALSWSF